MTSYARGVLSLDARVLGATLIIVGTVEDDPLPVLEYATDPPQVHSTFRIAVQDTLRGRAPGSSVEVRFLGGDLAEIHTPPILNVRIHQRALVFLTPYCAVDADPDTFVTYFRGYYPVGPNGTVQLDPSTFTTIDAVGAAIRTAQERQHQRLAAEPPDQPVSPRRP